MNLVAESYTLAADPIGESCTHERQARSSNPSCRLPSLSPLQQLLSRHKIINPHHEEGHKASVGFIGTAALSERVEADTTLYRELEQQYDAALAASNKKIPARFRAKKNTSGEEIAARKQAAVIDWTADACLELIKEFRRADKAHTLSRTNNFSKASLPAQPHSGAEPVRFRPPAPPVHEELRASVRELRERCTALKDFTLEWDHTKPVDSLIAFTEACNRIFKLALTIDAICGPKNRVRVSTEIPTNDQVTCARKHVSRAIKVIDQARKELSEDLTAPERIRLQGDAINNWTELFFEKHKGIGKVRICLTRWKISKGDVTQALRGCGDKELTIHKLRDAVAEAIEGLCASRARAHLERRNPDNLIPAEIVAKGPESISEYLNAEHGWKFRGANKAWLAMSAAHPELFSFDPAKRFIFLHRYIVAASKIDPFQVIQAALTCSASLNQKIEAPYVECVANAWRQTFGDDIVGKDQKRFYGQLSDLLGTRMREEPDDAHVSYYIKEPQIAEVRRVSILKFISGEFRCITDAMNDARLLLSDAKIAHLEDVRRETVREAMQMTNLMRSLFEVEPEKASARVQISESMPRNRDINFPDDDGGTSDISTEEIPKPRWSITNSARNLWANMSSLVMNSRVGQLLSSQPVLRFDNWLSRFVSTFPPF